MVVRVNFFTLPKAGNDLAENDDAFAVSRATPWQPEGHAAVELDEGDDVAVAIADGATESYLSGRWARLLADRVVHTQSDGLPVTIETLRKDWSRELAAYRDEREASGNPIAWYEEPKIESGSAATLALFRSSAARSFWRRLLNRDGHRSHLTIVGDCVVAHLHAGRQIRNIWPTEDPGQFGNAPDLISSRPGVDFAALDEDLRVERSDLLLMMTDAVGAWFLQDRRSGDELWRRVVDLVTAGGEDELRVLVQELRDNGDMRNDDVTIAVVAV